MTPDSPMALFADEDLQAPAGHPERFGTRWRLIGVGLSNVWRYGDLILDAASGRLLLRGPNGTGKTTALEALWPYLLDLNAQRLVAGKARTTTLSSLMKEGATGKRRYGYVWMTLDGPGSEGTQTFGVRLQFSEGASPAVKAIPFTVPGAPVDEVPLHGADRAPLMLDQFTGIVDAAGGQVFDDDESYVTHLAARVWGTTAAQLRDLAVRIRAVRNPSLLGEVSPRAAAEALREALPGVDDDIITATAEALAESDATREAFARDRAAAEVLHEFAATWSGHVVNVVEDAHAAAAEAAREVTRAAAEARRFAKELSTAKEEQEKHRAAEEKVRTDLRDVTARIDALERSDAYKAAGALTALEEQLAAERQSAATRLDRLGSAADTVRDQTASLTGRIGELADEIEEQVTAAGNADAAASIDGPLLTWSTRPRGILAVGGHSVDPGPSLVIAADPARLSASAQHWNDMAHKHQVRAGDAQLAVSDHEKSVQPADKRAEKAKEDAGRAAAAADSAQQEEDQAAGAARAAAGTLLDALRAWTTAPENVIDNQHDGTDEPLATWTVAEVDDLRSAEPRQTLEEVSLWANTATQRAADKCATLRARRRERLNHADQLTQRADGLRDEAADLRSGQLLPLPRPAWLDTNDDMAALGAALEWSPHLTDPNDRALVENAMATSGVLSARLTGGGVSTRAWQIRPTGPVAAHNLTAVLEVDKAHPLSAVAEEVLRRIALCPTATPADGAEASPSLVIGRDGTFRAGQLIGRPPGTDDRTLLPNAQHVGGAQRRAAALARAAVLDQEADELEDQAAAARSTAEQLQRTAAAIENRAGSFPPTCALTQAEAGRVVKAKEAARRHREATVANADAQAAAEHVASERRAWAERTQARSLPPDLDRLTVIHTESTSAASALVAAATILGGRLRSRLERLIEDVRRLDEAISGLPVLRTNAVSAHDKAAETSEKVEVLRANAGDAAQKAVNAHASASAKRDALRKQQDPARRKVDEATEAVNRVDERLKTAHETQQAAQPAADTRRRELQALLDVPGVTDVLFNTSGEDLPPDDQLLTTVSAALDGKRTYGRKTLRERYDAARAALAGTWTLDPADSYGELDTFVLTHDDVPFTPIAAARRAEELKERAQAALDAAEEAALRDFIIGRLPSAIGTAWTRLHDWITDVNRKMRSAAASSGVGVQVRARLADDLSPAARTVYELACRVGDADRTREQKAEVGQALRQLIAAADGPTMTDKLTAAVDVREWVDVHYEVTRPDGKVQRWSSKTGLSGGERRLVVLAPMIAAVAAAYDSLSTSGLRLAALDEVPAEVDERGREGLARYLAELDLDLVCTSYLWDGAPGAWDGIDAHDLEAAEDGTVVAFPMLVRGLFDIPGDETLRTES